MHAADGQWEPRSDYAPGDARAPFEVEAGVAVTRGSKLRPSKLQGGWYVGGDGLDWVYLREGEPRRKHLQLLFTAPQQDAPRVSPTAATIDVRELHVPGV